jgi:hypothetical protein
VSKLVELGSHTRYRPDVMALACGKVTAARARLGISRAEFGRALAHFLSWTPSPEAIEQWERCAAPPPGDVLAAADILTARANASTTGQQRPDYISTLLGKHKLSRDDLAELSASFDDALAEPSTDDIMRLAHIWLVSDTPQEIEVGVGRRISNLLVSTIEHRVIQLRRTDDFIAGRDSHALVRRELLATANLLRTATYTQKQARRLLTAIGELAQLAAWVAADSNEHTAAFGYVQAGMLAARAACNTPLAGNIISTLSYQIANTGDPRDAEVLARTAYAGAKRRATPITRALLLERIAWAEAKTGDVQNCERSLGAVNDNFSRGPRDNDPDWVYWLNTEEIDVMAGRCYTELNLPHRAKPLLRNAISRYDPTLARENILYLSWLAESYVELDELDEAATVGMQALQLTAHTASARADDRLRHVTKLLQLYKATPKVTEFLDAYRDASNPTVE